MTETIKCKCCFVDRFFKCDFCRNLEPVFWTVGSFKHPKKEEEYIEKWIKNDEQY
jgi:hypothetical protein